MIEKLERVVESAYKLRDRYPFIKGIDVMQISAAIDFGADAFFTDDGDAFRLNYQIQPL